MNNTLTDQQILNNWEYSIAEDFLLKDIQYRKPIYDPFKIFKPTKTFLKEVIKQLKIQCYEIIEEKNKVKNKACINYGETILRDRRLAELDRKHQSLLTRIRIYDNYCRFNGKNDKPKQGITDLDIARARQYPITELYSGKLRKSGGRLFGTCPFHSEKSASFVVYPENRYKCFGCGEWGDSIAYVMKLMNMKFIEAVKYLLTYGF